MARPTDRQIRRARDIARWRSLGYTRVAGTEDVYDALEACGGDRDAWTGDDWQPQNAPRVEWASCSAPTEPFSFDDNDPNAFPY